MGARSRNGWRAFLTAAALAAGLATASAQQHTDLPPRVTFPSLDGATTLTAILRHRPHPEPRPALVLLHGCTGLQRPDGSLLPVYRVWGQLLARLGYVVLHVDSAAPRGFGQTCTASAARRVMLAERPKDAYAALQWLQARPYVRADRIAALGWSQGGATVLRAIRGDGGARPATLVHDFRAAVALYPGGCSERQQARPQAGPWTTAVPLLVLLGGADNWTPAAPCAALLEDAQAHGAPVELKLYPDALHVFDAPNLQPRDLPAFRMRDGTVPRAGTDEAARSDALARVPDFLRRHLGE